jgi:hypothetical protein
MKKKLMGRLAFGLFIFMMLVSQNCLIAFADVVWEPQTDFYKKHQDECIYVDDLKLIVNGPGGSVKVWESPVSDREIDIIENSSKVYVAYTYKDKLGHEWGLLSRGEKSGWVPMVYLAAEPRAKRFSDLHGDEIQKSDQNFKMPEGIEKIYFYSFPGSGEIDGSGPVDIDESISIALSYTDKDGRQWGYVSYFRAQDGWLCMSDPGNDKIPVNEEDLAGAVMPPEPEVIITPQPAGNNMLIPVAILVVVVAGVTVVLIRVISKKNNKSSGIK